MKTESYSREDEWLQARLDSVNCSELAGIMGRSTWQSAYGVWQPKVDRQVVKFEPTPMMDAGHRHERTIAEWFSETTGIAVADPGDYTRYLHDELPLACTPDRIIYDKNDRLTTCLELKCAWYERAKAWDVRCPPEYQIQVQGQLLVMGLEVGYYAVLLNGYDFRYYKIERHEAMQRAIRKSVEWFWQLVETKTPPPVDWTDDTSDAIGRHYPDHNGVVYLDWTYDKVHQQREAAAAKIALETKHKDAATNRLREAIGEAQVGVLTDGVTAYKVQKRNDKSWLKKTKWRTK
jgi:putative phage-type endonuclease